MFLMSRVAPIALCVDLVNLGRGVPSALKAAVNQAAGRGLRVLTRFVEARTRIFAERLRDVRTPE